MQWCPWFPQPTDTNYTDVHDQRLVLHTVVGKNKDPWEPRDAVTAILGGVCLEVQNQEVQLVFLLNTLVNAWHTVLAVVDTPYNYSTCS